jgi:hypothetical protein
MSMQSQNENGKQQPAGEADLAQNPEISEAWRSLLGLQSAHPKDGRSQTDPIAQVQPQTGDPWNTLLHAKGMEAVDLQKVRLHALHPTASDEDVEHALDIIQEATGQPPSQEK